VYRENNRDKLPHLPPSRICQEGSVTDSQVALATLGGWALVVAVVLIILSAALVRSERLLFFVIVDVEVLLLFWVFSMWWVAT
jgi:hypothetical protein